MPSTAGAGRFGASAGAVASSARKPRSSHSPADWRLNAGESGNGRGLALHAHRLERVVADEVELVAQVEHLGRVRVGAPVRRRYIVERRKLEVVGPVVTHGGCRKNLREDRVATVGRCAQLCGKNCVWRGRGCAREVGGCAPCSWWLLLANRGRERGTESMQSYTAFRRCESQTSLVKRTMCGLFQLAFPLAKNARLFSTAVGGIRADTPNALRDLQGISQARNL